MEAAAYRQLMKHHAGAPVVIATGYAGSRTGLTATAFCSLSDSPPTVLICVNKNASAHPVIEQTGFFSVNVLRDDQADLAACFAGMTGLKGEQRFDNARWTIEETGAPVMLDALASLDCLLLQTHDHGTHSVFVAGVQAVRCNADSEPLIYFRGSFGGLNAQVTSSAI
jgi:flavin reductase (DIM6/NTAB) family NADH-FMN oxidoreductase RutF